MKIIPQKTVKALFNNFDGYPFDLTEGQSRIFELVYEPEYTRVAIKAVTQYGKSDVVSMALIVSAVTRKEKILIVAPSGEQAKIIMTYVIDHLFDAPELTQMLEIEESIERLKRERSRKRITFRNGSEIFILTANQRELTKEAKNLMGFGATIVVVDESSLLSDPVFTKILRMVLTRRGTEEEDYSKKLVQLGNPFEDNHFARAFEDKRYKTLTVHWKQAVEEGRMALDDVQEARDSMSSLEFTILYESEFPKEGRADAIFPSDWVDLAVENKSAVVGDKKAGVDVARFGDDSTVYCFRDGGIVRKLLSVNKRDTMEVTGWARQQIDIDNPIETNIDIIGVGSGVYDRLNEEEYDVVPINVGEKARGFEEDGRQSHEKYYNLKAQLLFDLRDWFKPVENVSRISIPNDPLLIEELKQIRYAFDSKKRIKVESKEDMKKRIKRSPDRLDTLMLSFANIDTGVDLYIL